VMNDFNLQEHRDYVFSLITQRGLHRKEDEDDLYQEFCVFFYSIIHNLNKDYAPTTIISTAFNSFLSARWEKASTEKRGGGKSCLESLEDKPPAFLEGLLGEDVGEYTAAEQSVLLHQLLKTASEGLHVYFFGDYTQWVRETAEKEGVTRQAIDKRIKKELTAIRNL